MKLCGCNYIQYEREELDLKYLTDGASTACRGVVADHSAEPPFSLDTEIDRVELNDRSTEIGDGLDEVR